MRFKRRNLAWLTVIGALVSLVLLSGAAPAGVASVLIALFVVALLTSVIDLQPNNLMERMSPSPFTRLRMSPQAREAVERARRRGGLIDKDLTLLDVGLITVQSSREGMVMRRTRSVSKDEDGVRPFISLHVAPIEADRNALIRFEILDQNGQQQYVHEMKTYLRDGQMNVLADHHLKLAGNERLTGSGDWDLRVYVDGVLAGVLAFTLTPSLEERHRQFAPDEEREAYVRLQDEEDIPLSLEELLRSQSKQQGRQN